MPMITGAWGNTKIVCANHSDKTKLTEMKIQTDAHSLFYACPFCSEIDNPCKNRLSAYEYEHMLDHIASVVAEAEENNEFLNLQNYSWKRKNFVFRILAHDGEKMTVSVLDKTAI